MSLHCLSRAELICWSFHGLILIEIFGVFLSPSLLHIPPSFSLLLPSAAIAIQCFLVPLLCLFLWRSSPTLLGSCYSLLSSFFRFLQHPLISSWKLSWCLLLLFSASSFNYQKCFHISLSLSLSAAFICSLSVCSGSTSSRFHCFPACFLTSLPLWQGTCKTVCSYFFTCLQGNTGQFSGNVTHASTQTKTNTHTLSICSTDRL